MRKSLFTGILAVTVLAASAHAFSTDVRVSDIELGKHLLGPVRTVAGLADRVVLVEFWGYNCPPCRASLPKLAKWQTEYDSQGLVIIGIHCQRVPEANVKTLCEKNGVSYSIYYTGQIKGGMDFRGIPHCFLFDHTGRCIWRGHPMAAEAKMKAALEAAPSAMLGARKLVKLAAVSDSLKKGAAPGTVLKQMQFKIASHDKVLAEEAKYIVERLTEHGRQSIEHAKSIRDTDPLGCMKALMEVEAGYRFHAVGKEAKALLTQYKRLKPFKDEMAASRMLEVIKQLEKKLRPINTIMGPDTSSDRFKSANRTTLQQIAQGVALMKQKYPSARSTAEAEAIARRYGLM